jgi:DNA primase
MDVIALARAGFTHAVAPMGTALTEDQLELLWRVGPEPVLCFDGDKAGVRAAFRSIERALPLLRPGQSLRFAMLPDGQDPDDLIRASGPPAMQQVLDNAVPLVDMLWRREVEREPLNTPEAKAGLKSRLYKALDEIQNGDVKGLYKTELLARFDSQFGWQAGRSRRNSGEQKGNRQTKQESAKKLEANTRQEIQLMGIILEFPELLERVDERLFELEFTHPSCASIQRAVLEWWRQTKAVEKTHLLAHIEAEGLEQDYRVLSRQRLLIRAGMGGADASLDERAALWNAQAATLLGQNQPDADLNDTRARLVETISGDNSDGMHRAMRASKEARD